MAATEGVTAKTVVWADRNSRGTAARKVYGFSVVRGKSEARRALPRDAVGKPFDRRSRLGNTGVRQVCRT